jgi:hypothetical protein
MATWHPDAIRVPYADAGAFIDAPPRLVWHTVEGYNLPAYKGSAPHFTLSIKTGKLWQHVPVNRASSSLKHPSGTAETNHAHAIQVELTDAFAKDSQDWSAAAYARIASLARWIEKNAGVARRCGVEFGRYPNALPKRLSGTAWLRYSGHIGHQHVPNNDHGDPGALKISLVLGNLDQERKRKRWALRLARVRVEAKRYGWTRPRRVLARQLKALLGRTP